ncbi:Mobile element protein [Candidatus Enterovibrio altilux]|uniref:Mobile element protein n=1 Tax=Candidatus Enterovibrio altilux TaxID=1927128 RepID=A0A291B9C3_9GAMM|nr:Mobile element protein [Candidatus Enterovibrio luxaltus]
MPLRDLQKFITSVFKLTPLPLSCPHCSCLSKRTKAVNITFKTKNKGSTQHLVIHSAGLKVYSDGTRK